MHAANQTRALKREMDTMISEEESQGPADAAAAAAGADMCKGRVAVMRAGRRHSSHDLSFDAEEEEARVAAANQAALAHSASLPDIQACLQLDLSQGRPHSINQERPVSSTSRRPSSIVLLEASSADGRWLGIETSPEFVHAWS